MYIEICQQYIDILLLYVVFLAAMFANKTKNTILSAIA